MTKTEFVLFSLIVLVAVFSGGFILGVKLASDEWVKVLRERGL